MEDPFGFVWAIATHLEDLTGPEIEERRKKDVRWGPVSSSLKSDKYDVGRAQVSREAGVYFVGNTDSSTLIRSNQQTTGFIVVEFTPHGAYPIFGIPLQETAQLVSVMSNPIYTR